MKLGQEVWIHGYIDEMRKDIAIIKNEGGYFGAVYDEIVEAVNKAYENGFKAGQADVGNLPIAYNRGLHDAWETAKRIVLMTPHKREDIFGYANTQAIFDEFDVEESMKRISEEADSIITDLDALCEKYGTTYGGIIEVLEDKLD